MGKYTYRGERSIEPTKSDIRKARTRLRKHYRSIGYLPGEKFKGELVTPAKLEMKVDEIIEKAKFGWSNAKLPSSVNSPGEVTAAFEMRVYQLLGANSKRVKQKQKEFLKEKQKNIKDISTDFVAANKMLDPEEKAYIRKRFEEYAKDFEFNSSSDKILLNQVIVDEVILRRIEQERLNNLKGLDATWEAHNKEIQERYRRNLDNLGVSRKQRVEYDQNIEGNVAQLSMNVEEKLELIKGMNDPVEKEEQINKIIEEFTEVTVEELRDYAEEIIFMKKHDAFGERNIIPPAELQGAQY